MTTQLMIQRVHNGLIVSPITPGNTGSIDLSTIAVFPSCDGALLKYLQDKLDAPITMPEIVKEVAAVKKELSGTPPPPAHYQEPD